MAEVSHPAGSHKIESHMELYLTYIDFLNILNYSLTSKNRKDLTYKFRYLLLLNGKTGETRPVLWMHFDSCLRGASQVAQWWKSAWKCRRRKSLVFTPCVRKIPWRRKWQLTPWSDMDRGHSYVFPMVVPLSRLPPPPHPTASCVPCIYMNRPLWMHLIC